MFGAQVFAVVASLLFFGDFCIATSRGVAYEKSTFSTVVYPRARRDDTIIEDFHGTKVADPYRWLENPDAPETRRFVYELNAISRPFFNAAPSRNQIRAKLNTLFNYEKFWCPIKYGRYYYYSHNTGSQNQNVIYRRLTLKDKGEVFLDPNAISWDGSVSISLQAWTEDGSIFAYGLSEKGSDWITVKFRDVNKRDLRDVIQGVQQSELAWLRDNSGIFYSKYPNYKGTSVERNEYHSLYFHSMGTDSSNDVIVYDMRKQPGYKIDATVSTDGRYLIISVDGGAAESNNLYYYELSNFKPALGKIVPKPLFDKLDAKYTYIDNDGDTMVILTNKDAPNFKLIRISLKNHSASDLIPESKRRILDDAVAVAGQLLLVAYIANVKHVLQVHDSRSGSLVFTLPPRGGTVKEISAKKTSSEVFISFESFIEPKTVYRIDLASRKGKRLPALQEIWRSRFNGLDKSDFMVQQVFYKSKDSTVVPMYIVSERSLTRNGDIPVLLRGYGGFSTSVMPHISYDILFVKYFKGIVASANIRGGGEYGENWHKGGIRGNKQNAVDDFISAAEFLINNSYTRSKKLAIAGSSNGGLLVAICAQQRPELFGAVVGNVGLFDMLRYHKFTSGAYWKTEYGDPDYAKDFKYIYKYSPLHNIRYPMSGQWPATLMMTADHDDRVVPSHTLKYAATLYNMVKEHPEQTNPILFRIDQNSGHGKGKSAAKMVAETVDVYSFLQRVLQLRWTE
ncbi:unnamed protein product [Cylicocyclus nassatus]|uniref:Prolyl endopeptidase n=1 Tax=Cylicocyclus nassatus TaxID=53992 RepID=A0AA36GQD9_CYLNA|nr:unnamed protein product [Cylicocyclus nassatus]